MKIAVRGGHNAQATGAVAILNELNEDRKVYKSVISNLIAAGHEVLDVTPGNCSVNEDLRYGVSKANAWGADLFISIHFDKCYTHYEGALGTGTWILGYGGNAEVIARRIVNSVANGTGLVNRGVKTNSKLYELRNTNMSAVIVEVCFTEATRDVEIYNVKGPALVGKLIAEGICNKNINGGDYVPPTEPSLPAVSMDGIYNVTDTRTNAIIVGSGSVKVCNKYGQAVPGKYIDSLDRIFVDGVYPSRDIIEVIYPAGSNRCHAYINIDDYNRISFDYHMKYQNDSGDTYVWWDSKNVNVTEPDEILAPNYKASPMYRENGRLKITFYRTNGFPSDGYVRYEGEQSQKFYEDVKQGIVKVNTSLNVRDDVSGNIIGSVFSNEKVTILGSKNGWYHIEYNTSHGKKQGYVSSKYVEIV
ncbi:hypothetical protein CPD4_16 [Clostridium phage CPD4]|nr:hypothetical protein CPD4_16 [Clostridium phage CPD4]